ncbi:MAG: acyl-CoA thioesterase [Phycisphaerales bacterium]|nr:acyl-CoA thioesterase [Phycisphaerales bacterium]
MSEYHPDQSSTPIDEKIIAMRVVAMPGDTNPYGTIFGGIILSYIDQAGFVEARRHGDLDWVTAAIEKVEFHAPVHVGDIVTLITDTTRLGRTSIDVRVEVEAERFKSHRVVHVTSARLTMVGMRDGKPFPFRECPCKDESEYGIDE